tara:strand:- start:22 stop:480 length:459 start_codon:yes stop_codon:yes gene_type:complete
MKILRRISDKVVLYKGDLSFNENGTLTLGNAKITDVDRSKFEIVEGVPKLNLGEFSAGVYTFDTAWALVNENKQTVPLSVSRVQFLIAIHRANKTAELKIFRDGSSVVQQIRLDNEMIFNRKSKIVDKIRAGLSLTNIQMNLIFKRAGQVND